MDNFVNTRKNFPDAQKLSGRHCRRADEVFGTLVVGHWSFQIYEGPSIRETCCDARLHLIGDFVNTRKNFPDAQKLSGRQCRRADDVFGTLEQGVKRNEEG